MKPLLYTFVSEETLHSMAVTFYACVKLRSRLSMNTEKHWSQKVNPHIFATCSKSIFLPMIPVKKCTFLPVRRRSIWARPIFLPAMQT